MHGSKMVSWKCLPKFGRVGLKKVLLRIKAGGGGDFLCETELREGILN